MASLSSLPLLGPSATSALPASLESSAPRSIDIPPVPAFLSLPGGTSIESIAKVQAFFSSQLKKIGTTSGIYRGLETYSSSDMPASSFSRAMRLFTELPSISGRGIRHLTAYMNAFSELQEVVKWSPDETSKCCVRLLNARILLESLFEKITPDLSIAEDFFCSVNDLRVPTVFGLVLLSCYYENKYGITLSVETERDFSKKLFAREFPMDSPYGVIVISNQEGKNQHATPFLCLPIADGNLEILALDTLGSRFNVLSLDDRVPEYVERKVLSNHRQSDEASCRNDAISILVNALLDIREKEISSLFAYTNDATKLPAAWAKTIQRKEALEGIDLEAPVRTKQANMQLGAFLRSHSITNDFGRIVRNYVVVKGRRYAAHIVDMLQNKDKHALVWSRFTEKLPAIVSAGYIVAEGTLDRFSKTTT